MKKTSVVVVIAAVLCVITWHLRGINAAPAAAPAPAPLKVAVVNVTKVLNECLEKKDIDKVFDSKAEKIREEMKGLDNKARDIEKEMTEALTPGSKDYSKKLKEYFDTKAKFEGIKEYQTRVMSVESQTAYEGLYAKLLTSIKKISLQKQVTLVVNKDETPTNSTRSLNELVALIRTRQVLYNHSSLDMTAEVIGSMDQAYEKEKSGK